MSSLPEIMETNRTALCPSLCLTYQYCQHGKTQTFDNEFALYCVLEDDMKTVIAADLLCRHRSSSHFPAHCGTAASRRLVCGSKKFKASLTSRVLIVLFLNSKTASIASAFKVVIDISRTGD